MRFLLYAAIITLGMVLALPAFAAPKVPVTANPETQVGAQTNATKKDEKDLFKGLRPTKGPASVRMGTEAQMTIPAGYLFLNAKDTITLLERMNNIPHKDHLGTVFPKDFAWMTVFRYEATGHVSDDANDVEIDANAILQSYKDDLKKNNEERVKRGWNTKQVQGWSVKPHYDKATKNLEWGITFADDNHAYDNYNVRILGREGVMKVILAANPESYTQGLQETRELLKGYSFLSGRTHAEFVSGDKVAGYGVAALIGGGVAAAAIKSGVLGKFAKPIGVAILAGGAALFNFFRRKKKY